VQSLGVPSQNTVENSKSSQTRWLKVVARIVFATFLAGKRSHSRHCLQALTTSSIPSTTSWGRFALLKRAFISRIGRCNHLRCISRVTLAAAGPPLCKALNQAPRGRRLGTSTVGICRVSSSGNSSGSPFGSGLGGEVVDDEEDEDAEETGASEGSSGVFLVGIMGSFSISTSAAAAAAASLEEAAPAPAEPTRAPRSPSPT
jgi:hypothetical protein